MPVIDELYIRKGTNRVPVDSINNQTIEEIVVGGQSHHFAKESAASGVDSVVCDNAVNEPFRTIEALGNTTQDGTPSPDAPIDIVNAGDNGIDVKLSGANLIDIETLFPTFYFQSTKCWAKKADGSWYCFNVGMLHNKTLFTNASMTTGKLTLTVHQRSTRDDSSKGLYYYVTYTDGTRENFNTNTSTEYQEYSFTTNPSKTVETIKFSYSINVGCYIEYMMINWGERLPYEPYIEPTTISIPSEVTLTDGKVVPLRFAKVNKADYMLVDKANNSVKYIRNIGYLKSFKAKSVYTYSGMKGIQTTDDILEQKLNRAKGKCTHSVRIGDYYSSEGIWIGVNTTRLFWIRILDVLGITTVAEFNAWVDEQEANGTPVELLYELKTPIEYNLTETEFGQQLLSLTANKGTNILEITGASSLGVSYWRQVIPNEEI